MEMGNLKVQSALIGSVLIAGVLIWVASANESKAEPPKPVHSVSSQQIPVLAVEDASYFRAKDFRMLKLGDGHDYWVFSHKGGDRGYGGMAHSPECEKCVKARERLVDRL